MNIKTNTKEKFTVVYILEEEIAAIMAAELKKLTVYGANEVPHVVLNMTQVKKIDIEAASILSEVQQSFYEQNYSFVICGVQPDVEKLLEENELLELMNITPTESEAWDIVQMEEIERELMNDFE